jgi:hypothetical protein
MHGENNITSQYELGTCDVLEELTNNEAETLWMNSPCSNLCLAVWLAAEIR